jgi:hypothetical protein
MFIKLAGPDSCWLWWIINMRDARYSDSGLQNWERKRLRGRSSGKRDDDDDDDDYDDGGGSSDNDSDGEAGNALTSAPESHMSRRTLQKRHNETCLDAV